MPAFEELRPGVARNTGKAKLTPIKGPSTSPATPAPPARRRGRVILWSLEAGLTVVAEHHQRPKVLRERAGGWEVVGRQGQLAATTWRGNQPLQLQLTLMLDGKTDHDVPVSVQDVIDSLRLFGYKRAELKRPPTLQVIGAVPYATGVLLSHKTTPTAWVVEALDIDHLDEVPNGEPCQATAVVTLLEHVEGAVEQQALRSRKATTYEWKKGDTLAAVAEDELGDERRADWIRDANPKITKKGWSKVEPGTKVKIPKIEPKL